MKRCVRAAVLCAVLLAMVVSIGGPAMAAEPGHIQVKAPPGIAIFLDDQLMGTTTEEMGGLIIQDVPAGDHTLKAAKTGFRPHVARVKIVSGQVLVHQVARLVPKVTIKEDGESSGAALKRQVGCLIIVTLPVEATLDVPTAGLEGYRKKRGRVTVSGVPVGTHAATFTGLGKTLTRDLAIKPDTTTNVLVNFATGRVKITESAGMPEAGGAPAAPAAPDTPQDPTAPDAPPAPDVPAPSGQPTGAFTQRMAEGLASVGAIDRFQQAQMHSLRWLAAHQSPNGSWEAAGFNHWCDGKPVMDAAKRPDGLGKHLYDVGVTGLALAAFLSAGYTDRGKHPFASTVRKGLRFLANVQDPEGCFTPRNTQQYIYAHGAAALAMVEAYGMTGDPAWRKSAQKGIDFVCLARNPYFAWRYGIKPGDNDTSVTGWMVAVLKSAQMINAAAAAKQRPQPLRIDPKAFDGARAWLQKVTDPDSGRVGYVQRGTGPARPQELVDHFPGKLSESMTAAGVFMRVAMGADPAKSRVVQLGATLCAKLPPHWDATNGRIDLYYWYYGTLALYQVGGSSWRAWRAGMQTSILASQRKDTDYCRYRGSWDPIGPWGIDGGRVASTALMSMCMGVATRYPRTFPDTRKR